MRTLPGMISLTCMTRTPLRRARKVQQKKFLCDSLPVDQLMQVNRRRWRAARLCLKGRKDTYPARQPERAESRAQ
jgi:hypothetical protein